MTPLSNDRRERIRHARVRRKREERYRRMAIEASEKLMEKIQSTTGFGWTRIKGDKLN